MPKPNFSSLEEAWIDLTDNLTPEYVEIFGENLRQFFFAGAQVALLLMAKNKTPELMRDIELHTRELREQIEGDAK